MTTPIPLLIVIVLVGIILTAVLLQSNKLKGEHGWRLFKLIWLAAVIFSLFTIKSVGWT